MFHICSLVCFLIHAVNSSFWPVTEAISIPKSKVRPNSQRVLEHIDGSSLLANCLGSQPAALAPARPPAALAPAARLPWRPPPARSGARPPWRPPPTAVASAADRRRFRDLQKSVVISSNGAV